MRHNPRKDRGVGLIRGNQVNGGAGGLGIWDSVKYGAVGGQTDGGFGGFNVFYTQVTLIAEGSLNYDTLYSWGYRAHRELSLIGRQLAQNVYQMDNSTKLYAYFEGCSEGGREGWSQVQRYGDEWDGALIGAPAFRWSFQQISRLYPGVVQQTMDHTPSPCAFDRIVNETIDACDPLDGRTDGVISRSDLCMLNFNISSLVGSDYSCPAAGTTPEQNGTITEKDVSVAQAIVEGLHDSQGRRGYVSFQPGGGFLDVSSTYNDSTGLWNPPVDAYGSAFILNNIEKLNQTTFATLAGITNDDLITWMLRGHQEFSDTLDINWPDLTLFNNSGGKIIQYHGESDPSVPTAASVKYWDSVRQIMYPELSYNSSAEALNAWFKLFLVPGGAHCTVNPLQPNAPFPFNSLETLIAWVEQGDEPVMLPASATSGPFNGSQPLCAWPLRPLYTNNGMTQECRYDQESIDTWEYEFDAFKIPVY